VQMCPTTEKSIVTRQRFVKYHCNSEFQKQERFRVKITFCVNINSTSICHVLITKYVGEVCSTHKSDKKHTKFWPENLKGRKPLGKPIRIWKDNIKTDLTGDRMERCGVDASGSREGPVAGVLNMIMNFLFP